MKNHKHFGQFSSLINIFMPLLNFIIFLTFSYSHKYTHFLSLTMPSLVSISLATNFISVFLSLLFSYIIQAFFYDIE